MISPARTIVTTTLLIALSASTALADPCGMVPPVYVGAGQPITRVGLQQTYVFHKDGVETFVIRPGFDGKVDEFGMLIPFPNPPAVRKVSDDIFPHLGAAVDPPEVVVDLRQQFFGRRKGQADKSGRRILMSASGGLAIRPDEVRVVKREAVGMYEVVVLEAGSAAALNKWMDEHGYQYPEGMDDVCDQYIEDRWCFVAVKTKVGDKAGFDPQPAQRKTDGDLPAGSTFDGHVQAMGFRFESEQLVVPMRLSAFNAGELRNVVYLMTEGPRKIRSIPEEYVVRQIAGEQLRRNVTQPLPLRIIGGTEANIPEWQRKNLPEQRDPTPKNGIAKELFAMDLLAVGSGELSLPHEEQEKELLAIGEALGLRGKPIDELHAAALREESAKFVDKGLKHLDGMTLTLVDGDFPREVLGAKNLQFAAYQMPARRNSAELYDAKTNKAGGKREGVLKLGAVDWDAVDRVAVSSDPASSRPQRGLSLASALGFAGTALLAFGLFWGRRRLGLSVVAVALFLLPQAAWADPCGMVPPVYVGEGQPITRVGLQQTYVFHKDGVETFVIRPGFTGKVDEFGMLIPFPNPPAVRKVPDHVFPHLAAAVDPPEVVIDLRIQFLAVSGRASGRGFKTAQTETRLAYRKDEVRVVKKEAVGMYEVVVLEAGSSAALKKWMDEHGYKYPDGMDQVCDEYIEDRWCFVAVKTKVGTKDGADAQPAQRDVNVNLPQGSTFDGHVQAMGFRFESEELVVPMRLSAFNEGELRNVVYLMTEGPRKIRSIPEEYVVRQISGEELKRNVTEPLPLRIIGGSEADIPEWQRKNLPAQRDPTPKNAAAKELFAADLLSVATGELSLAHEEREKELLSIGEALGLRGKEIDSLHAASLQEESANIIDQGLADLDDMTLTVVDGDFPREVLSSRNLQFAEYRMPARRNSAEAYDTKINGPTGKKEGVLKLGSIDWNKVDVLAESRSRVPSRSEASPATVGLLLAGLSLIGMGLVWRFGRASVIAAVAFAAFIQMPTPAHADPCGMVPPVYVGEGQPITRVGLQQTYVFYKNGVETFVIRPGFNGNVDEFGMLIPFPNPPAVRKVPDHIFPHIAAAVDPPEVVIDLRWELLARKSRSVSNRFANNKNSGGLKILRDEVRVVKQEAVGMYEVAVLEAGSPAALKKWMDQHGYKYPEGMDGACEEYVKDRWCFVAVKTKVKDKEAVDPQPAQRDVDGQMPPGSTFDGHVQAMGFRFESEELVVPMRLASFNAGELRNIVYLLTDSPQKIRSIPEEYVVRQVAGEELFRNVTEPLPLRIIGGSEENIPEWQRKTLPQQRDPAPHNAAAMELFAGDLQAIETGKLTLQHEEKEKDLLAIGERLGLRGGDIDKLHADALAKETRVAVEQSLADVKAMTLTVVDGDFPREVLARKNLMFGEYKMPARRNDAESYDAKINAPRGKREGVLKLGAIDWEKVDNLAQSRSRVPSRSEVGQTSLVPVLAVVGLSLLGIGLVWRIGRMSIAAAVAATSLLAPNFAHADPCGMVPPISVGQQNSITRIGEQKTFVFYKDGVETFVIRPGFEGKTDEFGMLIPFPNPPALRKVPDHVFPHVAAAIDPPEVVIDLRWAQFGGQGGGGVFRANALLQNQSAQGLELAKDEVRVVKEEAVGMYEVAVLEAGSAAALKKWMDKHGYRYPEGMDKVCEEYVDDGWCFVAVKTKVGEKEGADPQPAQRNVNAQLPDGAVFDGHVQAMGFRFKTDELVVPMRLSAFNDGELRNIVYLLTDKPQKIRSIPEEYVVRQVSGEELHRNITGPLPLRIIGGSEKDIPDWQRKALPQQRDPKQHNAAAKDLFASDLMAVSSGELALAHEEQEKDMLAIGERLGLRGTDIDKMHHEALAEIRSNETSGALDELKSMTLTVVDGDFPREVLARKNLMFGEYRMPSRRNSAESYDAKNNGPGQQQVGSVILGAVDWDKVEAERLTDARKSRNGQQDALNSIVVPAIALIGLALGFVGIALRWRVSQNQTTN